MSSEDTIVEFLEGWKGNRFHKMYGLCQITWKSNNDVKNLMYLLDKKLDSFEVTKINEINDCMHDVSITVRIKRIEKQITARLLKEKAPFKPDVNGVWGVNPISLIRGI